MASVLEKNGISELFFYLSEDVRHHAMSRLRVVYITYFKQRDLHMNINEHGSNARSNLFVSKNLYTSQTVVLCFYILNITKMIGTQGEDFTAIKNFTPPPQ